MSQRDDEMSITELTKAHRVQHPASANDPAIFNTTLKAVQDTALAHGMVGDVYDTFVLRLLVAAVDHLYKLQQAERAENMELLGEDVDTSLALLDHFRWDKGTYALGDRKHPVAKLKEIRSVMLSIVERIPDAVAEPPFTFLQDTDAVVDVINTLWRKRDAWTSSFVALFKFLEVIGSPLTPDYERLFKDIRPDATIKAPAKLSLSKADLVPVRAAVKMLHDRAMKKLDHPDIKEYDSDLHAPRMQVVMDALVASYLYGCSRNHEPARRDLVTLVYLSAKTDQKRLNYCKITDTSVEFVFNYMFKVNPQTGKNDKQTMRKQPLVVDVQKYSPDFAAFLRKLEPVSQDIQGPYAHLFFMNQMKRDFGRSCGPNVLSCRVKQVFKRMVDRGDLEKELAGIADGVNKARHASVAEDRDDAKSRNVSASETASQHKRRGQKPPHKPASDQYGHNARQEAGNDDLDATVEMTAAHAIDTECVDITKEEIANGPAFDE